MPGKQGFASLSPAQRIAVSRKGGRVKVKKGFALMPKDKLIEASRKGGQATRVKRQQEDDE